MTYDYKITYDFDQDQEDYVHCVLPLLELLAAFKIGVKHVDLHINRMGDTNLTVHYHYHRRNPTRERN